MEIKTLSVDPRVTVRKPGDPNPDGKCVVYWMQRAQRALDNPALDVAVELGNELGKPVVVFLAPVPFYPHANLRHYRFLGSGIPDIEEGLSKRNVGFVLRTWPDHSLTKFCEQVRPAMVIGDENPLREAEHWRIRAAQQLRVPLWTVDADVIVPSRMLGKEHYAARTIRPRLQELLPQFLVPTRAVNARIPWKKPQTLHSFPASEDSTAGWSLDRSVSPIEGWRGGTKNATRILADFVNHGLQNYPEQRNHPELCGTSRLSPYLHYGHIGPLTVAHVVQAASAPAAAKRAFLDQLIVRRELAVNFVRFNSHYDSLECLEPWADRSFAQHSGDRRPIVYSEQQLEQAETHDPLWNAAHKQMVLTGWMHNYLRMYWAKKILEWSPSVAAAFQRAVWLNDRYELDGRDPNGYAGIAWAIVGKHDRPWFKRPIFGQVRYMSLASTGAKFDSKSYIAQMGKLERGHD
ncbi:MAG: deoxyribodipyrimidine photo-lyase [Acidobacteriales bacterium]|nr:deoxyribodipyrimidine photo-lyase [Terriglobales bacterium]